MGSHYYNGYTRRDYTPAKYFVEYRLSDGSTRTASFREEGAARQYAIELSDPAWSAMHGGCSFVRFYRIFRKREIEVSL